MDTNTHTRARARSGEDLLPPLLLLPRYGCSCHCMCVCVHAYARACVPRTCVYAEGTVTWGRGVCACVIETVCVCVCVCQLPRNGVIQSTLSLCHRQFWGVLWTFVSFRLRLVRKVSTAQLSSASCLHSNLAPGLVAPAVHSAFASVCGRLLYNYHCLCSRRRPALTPVASPHVL